MLNYLGLDKTNLKGGEIMNLREAVQENEYIIENLFVDDDELNAFLFSLGCYEGEKITVISRVRGGLIVSIKESRYNIDNQLAEAIIVQAA